VNVSSITMEVIGTFTNPDTGNSGIYFEKVEGENGCDSGWSTFTVHTITGLAENTTYSYKIRARNADADTTDYCSDASTYTLLSAPSSGALSFVTYSSSVTVNISQPNNPELGFTGCEFMNTITGKNYISTGTYFWNNADLTENSTYTYKVRYKNASGIRTSFSGEKTTHTLCEKPSGFIITSDTESLTLSVSAFTNDSSGNSGYLFEYAGSRDEGDSSEWISTNTFTDDGLLANTSYTYRVYYRNFDGVVTNYSEETGWTLGYRPSPPQVSSPTVSSLKVVISSDSNPSYTLYAIVNVESGKYLQNTGALLPDTTDWRTWDEWGGSGGIISTGLVANSSCTYKDIVKNSEGELTQWSDASSIKYTLIESSPTEVNFVTGSGLITISADGFTNLVIPNSGVLFSETRTGKNSPWLSAATYQFSDLPANTSHFFNIRTRNIVFSTNSTVGPYEKATRIETVESLEFSVESSSIGVKACETFTNLETGQSGLYYVITDTGDLILNSTWTKNTGFFTFASAIQQAILFQE